jgi:SpoIID/LytB domain protein
MRVRSRRRVRLRMVAAAAVVLSLVVTAAPASSLPSAPALAPGDLIIDGHGWGHRRGMGQYGALGYAIDHGWSTSQILNHFYGGTTAGTVDPATTMTVRVVAQDNRPLLAQVDAGNLVTFVPGGSPVGAKSRAVRIEPVTGGFRVSDAATCAGPWTVRSGTVAGTELRVRSAVIGSTSFSFGTAGDLPITGDWNGDGTDTVGVWRSGKVYLRNTKGGGPAEVSFTYGQAGDVPIVGDWNGDGTDTIGVRRGRNFYLRNSNTSGPGQIAVAYGLDSDTAVVGDWDGNGTVTVGVRRGASWYLRNANTGGPAQVAFAFGLATDAPVVGNWNGIGADGIGVRRGTTYHLRNALSSGPATTSFTSLGAGSPLAGRWKGAAADWVGRFSGGAWELAGAADGAGGITIPPANDLAVDRTLQLCHAASTGLWSATPTTTRYYRGELRAVQAGGLKTVNAVGLDAYLRGVVPRESPASWGTLDCAGGAPDCGQRALEAQAVAARSYSMAENRAPYAKTCDTTSCQVYRGRAHRTSGGAPVIDEASQTNAAIDTTGGQVRRTGAGAIALTEFSSSTGGWTAGGTYPSVVDAGDDTASNPNHNWTTTLTSAQLQIRYGLGVLQSASITSRSSVDGRAVTGLRLVFANGTVNLTGDQMRVGWNLKSTWFSFR